MAGPPDPHRPFGDCFAYALAFVSGEPPLCTGNDFPRTDVPRVGLGTD